MIEMSHALSPLNSSALSRAASGRSGRGCVFIVAPSRQNKKSIIKVIA